MKPILCSFVRIFQFYYNRVGGVGVLDFKDIGLSPRFRAVVGEGQKLAFIFYIWYNVSAIRYKAIIQNYE